MGHRWSGLLARGRLTYDGKTNDLQRLAAKQPHQQHHHTEHTQVIQQQTSIFPISLLFALNPTASIDSPFPFTFSSFQLFVIMPNPQAEAIKTKGNEFFKAGKYAEAIAKYKEATAIDANVASYWSNMAACYEKLNKYEEMAEASRSCIKADKNFVKGYFRLAVAYKQLNDLSNCIKTLESGLAVQSSNADLRRMKKEVTELQRNEQVAAYCNKAEELMQNGDIAGAMKQLEFAGRMDAGNPIIKEKMDKVKPKFDEMEKKRKASLSPVERYKEDGDQAYKNANFEVAVQHYTKCLDQLEKEGKQGSDLALKAYANRAGKFLIEIT
jgi:tetratricopeptide (TPR) repeat protein